MKSRFTHQKLGKALRRTALTFLLLLVLANPMAVLAEEKLDNSGTKIEIPTPAKHSFFSLTLESFLLKSNHTCNFSNPPGER